MDGWRQMEMNRAEDVDGESCMKIIMGRERDEGGDVAKQ